jgi:hypothetical protein
LKPRRRRALLAACSSDRNACEWRRATHVRSCPRPRCSLARIFYQKRSKAGSEGGGGLLLCPQRMLTEFPCGTQFIPISNSHIE